MNDWLLPILFLGLASIYFILKELSKDEKVEVLYGYPAYRKTWLTIYHYRRSDKWVFEWDDLFDGGRPKSWGDISLCLMYEDKKSGATREEYAEAWRQLNARGLR